MTSSRHQVESSMDNQDRYPWVEGFDTMFDATFSAEPDSLADRSQLLAKVGIWACADGLCFDVCAHSINAIREREGYDYGSVDVYGFLDGARAALDVLTAETVIVQKEVKYV